MPLSNNGLVGGGVLYVSSCTAPVSISNCLFEDIASASLVPGYVSGKLGCLDQHRVRHDIHTSQVGQFFLKQRKWLFPTARSSVVKAIVMSTESTV